MAGEHARLRCSQRNDVILEISRNSLQFPMQSHGGIVFISLFFLHPSLHVTSCHFPPFSPLISSAKLSSAAVATPTPGSRVPPRWTKMDPASNTNHSPRHCVQSQGPQGLQGSPASMDCQGFWAENMVFLGFSYLFSMVFHPFPVKSNGRGLDQFWECGFIYGFMANCQPGSSTHGMGL